MAEDDNTGSDAVTGGGSGCEAYVTSPAAPVGVEPWSAVNL